MSEQFSGTHGPARDEAIKREEREEIREAAEDWPEPEDEGDEAPADATWAPEGRFGAAEGQEWEAIELRSDLARHLDRTAFPATRQRLLEILTAQFAEQRLLDLVSSLPHRRAYATFGELERALGLPHEERP